ncbi:MAG: SpoIIIAH-like family protein [Clostridia bacterium]|nr:SpoIIIAH-like family protein [Clostridia bacterium]
MTFGKRQLVIAAMVVALGAAVYLNWQFAGNEPVKVADSSSVSSSVKQLGQTTYVNTELSDGSADKGKTSQKSVSESTSAQPTDSSEVNTSLSKEQQEFFVSEKAKRDKNQEKSIESLSEIIESASSSESAKQEAVKAADLLAKTIKAEGDIEAEIKTKGFEECMVAINNQTCTVIVTKGTLSDATAISVKDIVHRQGNIEFNKITITEI